MSSGKYDVNKNAEKSAVITGASGFVGSNLARHLIQKKWRVNILSRESTDISKVDLDLERVKLFRHDGSFASLKNCLGQIEKESIVFHLASLFKSEHSALDLDSLIDSNIRFPSNLLEAMSFHGFNRLINTGTSWQHFKCADYEPVNLYAATKQGFEDIIEYYVKAKKFSVVTLKLFDTYGPNDRRNKLVQLLIEAGINNRQLDLSPGEQFIDLVYIQDVLNAYEASANLILKSLDISHDKFFISSGRTCSIKQLVSILEMRLKKKMLVSWGKRDYRDREVMLPCHPAILVPNWQPKTSLESGLSMVIDHYQTQGNL